MQKLILFTREGYEQKEKEYEQLLASRPEAVSELAKARAMGDLSENGYYKSARFKLSDIDRRLRELKHIVRYGKVKEITQKETVDIGSTVSLTTNDVTKMYTIVGTYESNPSEGKISIYSPLGKALSGKRVGETVLLDIVPKQVTYTILSIR